MKQKTHKNNSELPRSSIEEWLFLRHSPAFISLTGNQRELYRFCRFQEYNKDNEPWKEHPLLKAGNGSKLFFMNWALVQTIELYGSKKTFHKDLKRLIELGFIDCLHDGKGHGTKSIYTYSDKWQTVKGEIEP